MEAAVADQPEGNGKEFVYTSFFAENRNGDQGEVCILRLFWPKPLLLRMRLVNCLQFAEEFRDQFTAERLEYMNEIEDAIRNTVDERYKRGQGPSGARSIVDFSISGAGKFATFRLTRRRTGFAKVAPTDAVNVVNKLDPEIKPK
jgi:hypothetical protein